MPALSSVGTGKGGSIMRRWLGLALAPVAAAAIIGLPGAAHAAGAAPAAAGAAHAEGTWGQITSRWSKAPKCVDIRREDGPREGALAQLWDCTNTPEQQFAKIRFNGDNDFLLENQRSGMCLRPSESSTGNGALIEQALCNPGDLAQHWKAYDPGFNSTGAKWLRNLSSDRCLEDSAWNTSNGTLLTQDDCVLAWKQYWFGV
jgi:hypothetical protein